MTTNRQSHLVDEVDIMGTTRDLTARPGCVSWTEADILRGVVDSPIGSEPHHEAGTVLLTIRRRVGGAQFARFCAERLPGVDADRLQECMRAVSGEEADHALVP